MKSASLQYLSSSHTNSTGHSCEYSCKRPTGLTQWYSENVINRYANIAVDVEFTNLLNASRSICDVHLSRLSTVEPTSKADLSIDVVLVSPRENQNEEMTCASKCDGACVTSPVQLVTHPRTVTSVPNDVSNASMSSSVVESVSTISRDKTPTQMGPKQQNVSTETSDDSHFEVITDPAPERGPPAHCIDISNCATLAQTKLSGVHKDHFIVERDTIEILVDGRGHHLRTKDILCRNGANHCGSTSSGGLSGGLVDYTGYIDLEAPL